LRALKLIIVTVGVRALLELSNSKANTAQLYTLDGGMLKVKWTADSVIEHGLSTTYTQIIAKACIIGYILYCVSTAAAWHIPDASRMDGSLLLMLSMRCISTEGEGL
jgi:hypothetical protein